MQIHIFVKLLNFFPLLHTQNSPLSFALLLRFATLYVNYNLPLRKDERAHPGTRQSRKFFVPPPSKCRVFHFTSSFFFFFFFFFFFIFVTCFFALVVVDRHKMHKMYRYYPTFRVFINFRFLRYLPSSFLLSFCRFFFVLAFVLDFN